MIKIVSFQELKDKNPDATNPDGLFIPESGEGVFKTSEGDTSLNTQDGVVNLGFGESNHLGMFEVIVE